MLRAFPRQSSAPLLSRPREYQGPGPNKCRADASVLQSLLRDLGRWLSLSLPLTDATSKLLLSRGLAELSKPNQRLVASSPRTDGTPEPFLIRLVLEQGEMNRPRVPPNFRATTTSYLSRLPRVTVPVKLDELSL